ncbi:MAG: GDP-mannose 4,6-dehydratase [Bdellovibrionota bacterium]
MSDSQVAIVTGGAGFIGSHMVDLLVDRGFVVRVIDSLVGGHERNLAQHKTNPSVSLDTRDLRGIDGSDPIYRNTKYLFHFAGLGDIVPSIEKPVEYMDTNVMATVRALEGARANAMKRFVYAASSSCYGLATELPTTELAPTVPQYPYALSKFLGEQTVFHWGQVYKLPVNSIRIFNAYGPRSRTSGVYGAVFGVFLRQKLAGQAYTIVGDGTQTRDFIFVTDLARAFLAAAETEITGEVFNAGAGNPQSVNRLVELLGGEQITHVPKRPGEPDCTWADISKARAKLGWEPKVSFADGVAEMLKHIDYWRDAPLWDEKSIAGATKTWFQYLQK